MLRYSVCSRAGREASVTMWRRFGWRFRGDGPLLCPRANCARRVPAPKDGAPTCPACRQALPATDGAGFTTRAVALVGSDHCGQTSWLMRGFDGISRESERYRFAVDGQEKQWEESLHARF